MTTSRNDEALRRIVGNIDRGFSRLGVLKVGETLETISEERLKAKELGDNAINDLFAHLDLYYERKPNLK